MAIYVVRVWLPDRPGALGQVASRIGALRGDVIGIEILERGAGRAIDELVVSLPEVELLELLITEIAQVDGVDVEDVREVDRRAARPAGRGARHRRTDGRRRGPRGRARRAVLRAGPRPRLRLGGRGRARPAGHPMLDRSGALGGLAGGVPAGEQPPRVAPTTKATRRPTSSGPLSVAAGWNLWPVVGRGRSTAASAARPPPWPGSRDGLVARSALPAEPAPADA